MRFTMEFMETRQDFKVGFNEIRQQFDAGFENLQIVTTAPDVELYSGTYDITPTVGAQTLPTAQRYMVQDVNVNAIPFYNVGNTAGGSTVYIADNIEFE